MSNLTLNPKPIWHDNINQVEVTEPILGGDGGNANLATRQLAENCLWLKQKSTEIIEWQNTHINNQNPHSQYVLGQQYIEAINQLNKRIDELSTSAGVGTVLGRLDIGFSGATGSYSAQSTISSVGRSIVSNGSFNLIPVGKLSTSPMQDITCRRDDPSLVMALNYPEGFDPASHEVRSNYPFVVKKPDGTGITFVLPYTSDREADSNFYRYFINASYYFEIVKK